MRTNLVFALFGALVLSACGSKSGTGPSDIPGTGGTTLVGNVRGTVVEGTSAATTTAHTNAVGDELANLEVRVEGRDLAAMTDANGQFVLANVPAGAVTLRFKGTGIDARLGGLTVNNGQTLNLRVGVAGNSAVLLGDGDPTPTPTPGVAILNPPAEYRSVVEALLTSQGAKNLFPAGNCVNIVLHDGLVPSRDEASALATWGITKGGEGCMLLNIHTSTDPEVRVERAGPDDYANGVITRSSMFLHADFAGNIYWARTLGHALTHAAYGMGDAPVGSGGAADPSNQGFFLSAATTWFMEQKQANVGKTLALAPLQQ